MAARGTAAAWGGVAAGRGMGAVMLARAATRGTAVAWAGAAKGERPHCV